MHHSVLEAIGNTPLISVNFGLPANLCAKLEYLNPGGSVKDRSALFMIEQAEKEGILQPGGTLIDASSGNQGIATAMIGAFKGYNVIITVSEKSSTEKINAIKAYGAQVVICPATAFLDHPDSYHSQARALHEQTPNSFMPNQYYNLANSLAHYTLLGPEIYKQTKGMITHFFAAAGTSGTVSGVGKYLKEQDEKIQIIAVDSVHSWHATGGCPKPYKIEGMGLDFATPIFNKSVIDEIITVSDEDALGTLKTLAHTHGILAGPSSGAVAWAAKQYATQHNPENMLGVMIFGDSGRAYLSKGFYL